MFRPVKVLCACYLIFCAKSLQFNYICAEFPLPNFSLALCNLHCFPGIADDAGELSALPPLLIAQFDKQLKCANREHRVPL